MVESDFDLSDEVNHSMVKNIQFGRVMLRLALRELTTLQNGFPTLVEDPGQRMVFEHRIHQLQENISEFSSEVLRAETLLRTNHSMRL